MKLKIALAMIICGTVLVALPFIFHIWAMSLLTDAMVALQKDVHLTGDLPDFANGLSMAVGIIMILVGFFTGLSGVGSEKSSKSVPPASVPSN
jgi:hypothetical protein